MNANKLVVLTAALAWAAGPVSAAPESLRLEGERSFAAVPVALSETLAAESSPAEEIPGSAQEAEPAQEPYPMPQPAPQEPVLQVPGVQPLGATPGQLVGSFKLADRLDTHRDLFTLQLGPQTYDMSLAADAKFESQYLSFLRQGALQLRKIKDPNELRGAGIIVALDDGSNYRFKVSINIFNPVRGSTLNIDPVNGTQGPSHKIKTGRILERTKEESFVFAASGKEFWVQYGTDVDPATDKLANTRSLLFTHEAGMSTKAWPIAEASLDAGKPLGVTLGDTRLVLLRTAGGELRIHLPGPEGASSAR